jgi:hypothetical protein
MTRREAIQFLNISEKYFDNYHKYSGEIIGTKIRGRWNFDEEDLNNWKVRKNSRTVRITLEEYEKCLNFGIEIAYSLRNTTGTGIRGARSKMQTADDFTFGILAEIGFQKFLRDKFNTTVNLDHEVHTEYITPQDIVSITENGIERECRFKVAIKSSKYKSCFNIIKPLEYDDNNRNSDRYVFIRVNLPDDHIFGYFKNKFEIFSEATFYNSISNLDEIEIWICGYSDYQDFTSVLEIPGQKFDDGYRYVVSTANMKNTDEEWRNFVNEL